MRVRACACVCVHLQYGMLAKVCLISELEGPSILNEDMALIPKKWIGPTNAVLLRGWAAATWADMLQGAKNSTAIMALSFHTTVDFQVAHSSGHLSRVISKSDTQQSKRSWYSVFPFCAFMRRYSGLACHQSTQQSFAGYWTYHKNFRFTTRDLFQARRAFLPQYCGIMRRVTPFSLHDRWPMWRNYWDKGCDPSPDNGHASAAQHHHWSNRMRDVGLVKVNNFDHPQCRSSISLVAKIAVTHRSQRLRFCGKTWQLCHMSFRHIQPPTRTLFALHVVINHAQ